MGIIISPISSWAPPGKTDLLKRLYDTIEPQRMSPRELMQVYTVSPSEGLLGVRLSGTNDRQPPTEGLPQKLPLTFFIKIYIVNP